MDDAAMHEKSQDIVTERDLAQQYLDIAGVILVAFDDQARITLLNRMGYQVLGYDEGELNGKDWFATCLPPDEAEVVHTVYRRLIAGDIEPVERFENHVCCKDGSRRLIAWRNTVLRDPDGRIIGTLSSGEDITERRRVENELNLLKRSIDRHPDGMYWMDTDNRFVYVNDAACSVLGRTRDELLGHTIDEVNPLATPEVMGQVWARLRQTGSYASESIHRCKDGTEFPVEIMTTHVVSKGKEYNCGFARDITDRKLAEAALRDSEAQHRALIRHLHAGVVVHAADTSILLANEQASVLLGLTIDQMMGKTAIDPAWCFLREDETPMPLDDYPVNRVLATRIPLRNQVVGITRPGQDRAWVLVNAYPELDPSGALRQIVVTFVDITERKQAEEALRESEDRLSFALKHSCIGSWSFDLENGTATRTLEHAIIFGYDSIKAPWTKAIFLEHVLPDDRDRVAQTIAQTAAQKGTMNFECRIRRCDGEVRWVWIAGGYQANSLHHPSHIAGIIRDITERKHAEEALRRSEEKYRAIFENVQDIFYQTDMQGTIIEISPSIERYSGFPREELIGKPVTDVYLNPADRDGLLAELQAHGEVVDYQLQLRAHDGRVVFVSVNAHFIYDNGVPIGVEGSLRDISERKQAQDALADEKERLRVTLRSIGDGVIATDTEGRVTMMNRVAETLTGWTLAEAEGRPLTEIFHIIHEVTRQRCANPVEEVLTTGGAVELANHTVLIARDGTERIIADSGAPIAAPGSRIVGVVLVFRDVTQESRMRDELQRMAKLDSLSVMAGGIAHDFNNLLTAIAGNMGLAQWALRTGETRDATCFVGEAENAAMRARDLTQQLLTFAKGGAPVREQVAVAPLIREAVGFALSGSRNRCRVAIGPDVCPVHADAGQLSQVLHNLLLNADQAMPDGGEITVTATNVEVCLDTSALPPGIYVRIDIGDTGVGIPADIQERIFDPFFTTKQRGSGLGLASVYSIVRGHDGLVRVASTPGQGSTFSVFIPAQAGPETHATHASLCTHPTRPWRILVMDDEAPICTILRAVLTAAGHTVETTAGGTEALATWTRAVDNGTPFDLAILDLTIPGDLGGKDVMARLRVIDPTVRAIASSGYASDPIMAQYRDYGFVGRLAKPYRVDEVLTLLRELQAD
jgi:PAS domain S-box-containing protein